MIAGRSATQWLLWLGWRSLVTRQATRRDAAAALTGAVIVLPQALSFASIAARSGQRIDSSHEFVSLPNGQTRGHDRAQPNNQRTPCL